MQLHTNWIFKVSITLAQKCSDFKRNQVFFHQKHAANWWPKWNPDMGVKRREGDKCFSPSSVQAQEVRWSRMSLPIKFHSWIEWKRSANGREGQERKILAKVLFLAQEAGLKGKRERERLSMSLAIKFCSWNEWKRLAHGREAHEIHVLARAFSSTRGWKKRRSESV